MSEYQVLQLKGDSISTAALIYDGENLYTVVSPTRYDIEKLETLAAVLNEHASDTARLREALVGVVRILEAMPPHGRVAATDAAIAIARKALGDGE